MKKIIVSSILATTILTGCGVKQVSVPSSEVSSVTPIRIGWQIPWATEGQLAQILQKTDILKNHSLKGDFKGFSYGAPLNEAALAGSVDVIFTADQPALTLISKDPRWVIIGRLMYNRVSLYVPPQSDITEIKDLRGKTVAMPFGAAAQRVVLREEKRAGLDPNTDVRNINLGIYEQNDLVKDATAKTWGEIDALAGFDPTPAVFEEKGLIKNLYSDQVVSVIVMSKDYINMYPWAAHNFLMSFQDAYQYYRDNQTQANAWFSAEAGIQVSDTVLAKAASVEPNLTGKTIRLDFTPEDYKIMEEAADFLFSQGITKEKVNINDHIDLQYLLNL